MTKKEPVTTTKLIKTAKRTKPTRPAGALSGGKGIRTMAKMSFKNKSELINFIKHQTNIILIDDPQDFLNKNHKLLYTNIGRSNKNSVLGVLKKYNIIYEPHAHDYYFISLK